MSWLSYDRSPSRAFALAILVGAALLSCSSGDSGSTADAGLDVSTSADAGGTDARTAADGASGDAATDRGAADTAANPPVSDAGTPSVTLPSTICLADGGTNAVGCCPVQTLSSMPTRTIIPRAGATGGQYAWTDPDTFSGYSYTYDSNGLGTPTLASDVSGGNWHLSGSIANYSGFGLGFSCMVDASAYVGVSFTIGGSIGEPQVDGGTVSHLAFFVATAADDFQDQLTTNYARCIAVTNQYDGTCMSPRATVAVSPATRTYSFLWADLTGGRTVINHTSVPSPVNPAEITRLSWVFDWAVTSPDGGFPSTPDGGPGYPFDITISDVSFITSVPDGGPGDAAPPDGTSSAPDAADAATDGPRGG